MSWTVVSHAGTIIEVSTMGRARGAAKYQSRADCGKAAVYGPDGRPRFLYSKGYFIPRKWWQHAPHRLLPRITPET